jgi:hypothetical protein
VAAAAGIVAAGIVSAFALAQWDASFNEPYRARVAALAAIPAGPFFAIDAAAWRWIADRPVFVTPSDGIRSAVCAGTPGGDFMVLEPAHFSVYAPLYDGSPPAADIGGIKVFPVILPPTTCSIGR